MTTYTDYTPTTDIQPGDVIADCVPVTEDRWAYRTWKVVSVKADGRIGIDNGAAVAAEIAKVCRRPRVSYYTRTSRFLADCIVIREQD